MKTHNLLEPWNVSTDDFPVDGASDEKLWFMLGTESDAPRDWLAAGQALARILLRARVEDVWASFLNQAIEVEAIRSKVGNVVEHSGCPQIILRLGFGPEVRPTPRRGVEEVLMHDPLRSK